MDKFKIDRNLTVIFMITLTSILGIASIYPFLPEISKSLDIPKGQEGYLIAIFAAPGFILTPLLGILADRYGRKIVLTPALFVFAIAGTAIFFVDSYESVLIFRFIQGAGAASLGALNVTLIGDLYSNEHRAKAMRYNNSALSLGTGSFPLIGGLVVGIAWNWPFLLSLIALPVGLATVFILKTPPKTKTITIGKYFGDILKVLKTFKMLGLFVLSLNTFIVLFGCFLTYVPFLLNKYESEPLMIAIILSSMSFSQSITAAITGLYLSKCRKRTLLRTSFILYAAALVVFLFMPGYLFLFIPTIIFGVAQGLNVPNVHTLLSSAVPLELRGATMSFNRMVSQIGQVIGPVLMGYVFLYGGLDGVFIAGAALALITFLLIFTQIK